MEFLFEPALEPGLSPTQRAELEARNLPLLHLQWGQEGEVFRGVGLEGKLRTRG